ncbi:MAG: hypothetical protein HY856_08270 [Burkholderiales bacterium]|nr:hypothetical protein [Burkholderiales bacterium]
MPALLSSCLFALAASACESPGPAVAGPAAAGALRGIAPLAARAQLPRRAAALRGLAPGTPGFRLKPAGQGLRMPLPPGVPHQFGWDMALPVSAAGSPASQLALQGVVDIHGAVPGAAPGRPAHRVGPAAVGRVPGLDPWTGATWRYEAGLLTGGMEARATDLLLLRVQTRF